MNTKTAFYVVTYNMYLELMVFGKKRTSSYIML